MKYFTTLVMAIIFSLTLSFNTSFAGNDKNHKDNGNHYGWDKKCNCDCQVDIEALTIVIRAAVKAEMDEYRADQLEESNQKLATTTAFVEPEVMTVMSNDTDFTEALVEVPAEEMDPRKFALQINDDDHPNYPGRMGIEINFHSDNEELKQALRDTGDGFYNITISMITPLDEEIILHADVLTENIQKDYRELYFNQK